METKLRTAIKGWHVIKFTYQGQRREVHPIAIIENAKEEIVLAGMQVGGGSNSGGPLPCWRHFNLNEIEALLLEDEIHTGIPPDFNPLKYHNVVFRAPSKPSR